jgi:DNA-binding NarL/FixJ family response regulator
MSTTLTPRETQVAARLVTGDTNSEIAAHLEIGLETVKWHVANILRKVKVRNRTQAAVALLSNRKLKLA